MATIGENLRRIRKTRGWGQVPLAEASGVSQPTISEIERDQRDPHPSTLRKLGAVMGVELAAFFAEDGPPKPPKTPLTDEPEDRFDERFAATDVVSAEKLQEAVGKEFDALQGYVRRLKAAGTGDDALRLKQARRRLKEAKRRTYAATSRATDLALNAEFGRDKEIHGTIAAYVGQAQETADRIAAEGTEAPLVDAG